MNRFSLICLAALLVLAACERVEEQPIEEDVVQFIAFGEEIPQDRPALDPADLAADPIAYHGEDVRVEGTIVEVCQRRGCWLAFETEIGEAVKVHVPRDEAGEYLWTVPMDLGRRHAIVEGQAYADTLGVDELRHFAEDAGRPEAEIEAIDEPQIAAQIRARGLLVEEPAAPAPAPDVDAVDPPDVPVDDAAEAPADGADSPQTS